LEIADRRVMTTLVKQKVAVAKVAKRGGGGIGNIGNELDE